MKKFYSLFIIMALFFACSKTIKETIPTKESKEEEWVLLFNGRDLHDWVIKTNHYKLGVDPGNTFQIKDSMIRVSYSGYGDFNERFAHLYYKKPFSYYHLVVEYRFTGKFEETAPGYARGNSGVMLHAQDPKTILQEQPWPIAVEFQFLSGLGDGRPRPTGNMCSPGTDVIYKDKIAPVHCLESTSKTYDGEQWVKAEAFVLGDSLIKHIINGDTVLEYSKPHMGDPSATNFDSGIWQSGKPLKEGYIALQSEGSPVDFRVVKLLNLKGCMDPKALNYKIYYVQPDPASCKYEK